MSGGAAYEPKPGTVADRALAWLEEQPSGTEVTSSKWAEALGIGTANLIVGVSDAVMHGALERFTKHGQTKPFFYRLPTSTKRRPRASSPIEKPEAPPPVQPRIDMLLNGAAPAENDEPKGLAGAARGPVTSAEETTQRSSEAPTAAAYAPAAGDDAKRDGGPASPGGAAPESNTRAGNAPQFAQGEAAQPCIAGEGETHAEQRVSPPRVRKPKASSAAAVERAAKDVKQYKRAIHQRTPPDPEPASAASPLVVERFAYWSSGELAFERGAEVIVLPAAVAQQFFAFARRVGEPA